MHSRFTISEANVLYGLAALLLILSSLMSEHMTFVLYAVFVEMLVFVGPIVFMGKHMGISIKTALNLNHMTSKQWLYSFLMSVSLVPISLFLSLIVSFIFIGIGIENQQNIPLATNTLELGLQIIVIGLMTGISEELFFRGMYLRALEPYLQKKRDRIWFVAFLFAIMHFDLQNFINPLFLGVVFGYMVTKTKSVYSSMLGHFVINSVIVVLLFLFQSPVEEEVHYAFSDMLATSITFGIFAIIGTVFALSFYKKMSALADSDEIQEELIEDVQTIVPDHYTMKKDFSFLFPLAVLLFYCLVTVLILNQK